MFTNKDILIHDVDGGFTKFGAPSFCALLVILIIFSFRPLVAQTQKVDSLKSILEQRFGPNQQLILFELAYHFTDSDNHLAMDYLNQAAKLSYTFGDSLMIVKCGRLKSLLYRRFDQMDSSLILSRRILPIAERNKFNDEIKKILNGLALVYSYRANYDEALSAYLSILDLFDPTKNKSEASVILQNIGLVYFKLDDLDKALYYFNKSLALKDQANDQFDI
ncbi:MAG TPA: tetratricopeptide repeat protein, partial [Chryseolinea sp.]